MKRLRLLLVASVLLLASRGSAWAQPRAVTITIPTGVSFAVNNIAASTTGSPNPFRITFTNTVNFKKNDNLNISVKADTTSFSGPAGTQIPASAVSWTATTPAGVASNGTLSSTAYGQVFISPTEPSNGSVSMVWTLAPIAASGLHAGTHTITVRWRLEFL